MSENTAHSECVAAVQFEPQFLKPRKNVALAKQYVFEAAAKGARVVVLPELCMSGYNMSSVHEAADVAQTRNGWQTQEVCEVAKQMNCFVVFGYVELYEGNLYNSAVVVGPSGPVGNTQKHNLSGADNLWAKASEALNPVIVTPAGRLGILICRDAMNHYRESYRFYRPEERFYRRGSIDTIALLTNWGSAFSYPDSTWVELAEGVDANVIVSNRVGKERDVRFKGGSAVIDRNKRIWTNGSSFDEAAVVGGIVLL